MNFPPASDAASSAACDQPTGFVLASCAYPAGVLDGSPCGTQATRHPGPAHQAFHAMARRFELEGSLRFSILTGDQIYADATAGLFDPGLLDDALRTAYDKRFKLNAAWAEVTARAPEPFCHFTLFDDHEIRDNWAEGGPPGQCAPYAPAMSKAVEAYIENSRGMCWPRHIPSPRTDPDTGRRRLWQDTVAHGYPLFLADTRTERDARTPATLQAASLIGAAQQRDLCAWIARHAGEASQAPRFIVSPSIVLPRRLGVKREAARAVYEDAWPGYPRSLHLLLACLCDHEANNIVLLSGDEHLSCVASIEIECEEDGRRALVHSIHSSALYAPFPFVNATPHEFAWQDSFVFKVPAGTGEAQRSYTCRVRSHFPETGDGFATVHTCKEGEGGAWQLTTVFHSAQEGPQAPSCHMTMGDADVALFNWPAP